MLVLEPEVEQIPQHVNALSLCLYFVEETTQVLLLFYGVGNSPTSQMSITYEIGLFQIVCCFPFTVYCLTFLVTLILHSSLFTP